jgi:diacylglycerol kinase (ATP)
MNSLLEKEYQNLLTLSIERGRLYAAIRRIKTMLTRILNSLKYALQGLRSTWREQLNFRLEILISCILIGVELWLRLPADSVFFLVIAVLFVLLAEIINTVTEDLLDEIVPQPHPLVGKAKDMMAGAVLIACFAVIVIFTIGIVYQKFM